MNKKKILKVLKDLIVLKKKSVSTVESKKQGKVIQCRECECFGHIQVKCANTLKNKWKSLKTT